MLITVERQGKTIRAGSIKGRRWEKDFKSSNSFIRLQSGTVLAFGLDKELYDRLKPDFDRFFWYDTEKQQHYTLDRRTLDELIEVGLAESYTYRDHGPQWAIPLHFWSIGGESPAVPPRAAILAQRELMESLRPMVRDMQKAKEQDAQLSLL